MRPVWLTVDTDDLRHTPTSQGHPTRSKGTTHEGTSPEMKPAMKSFRKWLDRTQVSLTMFVIADQLDDIYHYGVDGWKATIKAVKDKYTK